MIRFSFVIISVAIFFACNDQPNIPKPRAYPRILYPVKNYVTYNSDECPFTFEYPDYARIQPRDEKCWFDLQMNSFNASLHCSYLDVDDREDFEDLVRDAYEIADRINARANYMEESRIYNQNGVNGVMMEWTGPAASNMHFFLTDTTQHFFRVSLYFDAKVQPDSLQPVVEFIKEDVRHMISTFNWKKE